VGFEVPLDVDYPAHPKTMYLRTLIGPEADIYPVRLWLWAAKYYRSGILESPAGAIERSINWEGDEGRLIEALVEARFLEPLKDGKGYSIVDWMERAGMNLSMWERAREQNRNRKREVRAAAAGKTWAEQEDEKERRRQNAP